MAYNSVVVKEKSLILPIHGVSSCLEEVGKVQAGIVPPIITVRSARRQQRP